MERYPEDLDLVRSHGELPPPVRLIAIQKTVDGPLCRKYFPRIGGWYTMLVGSHGYVMLEPSMRVLFCKRDTPFTSIENERGSAAAEFWRTADH